MSQTKLKVVEQPSNNMDKNQALETAVGLIEKNHGKGSIMKLGSKQKIDIEYGPRRKGDAEILVSNIDKIKQMIDWKPKYNKLDFIVRTSIDWEIKLKNENFS